MAACHYHYCWCVCMLAGLVSCRDWLVQCPRSTLAPGARRHRPLAPLYPHCRWSPVMQHYCSTWRHPAATRGWQHCSLPWSPVSAVLQCPTPCMSAPLTAECRPTFPIQFTPQPSTAQPLSSPVSSTCEPLDHWPDWRRGEKFALAALDWSVAGHRKIYLSSGDQGMVSVMTLED